MEHASREDGFVQVESPDRSMPVMVCCELPADMARSTGAVGEILPLMCLTQA